MEPLAKTAYDAYRAARSRQLAQSLLPSSLAVAETEWDDLTSGERDAWDAASQAVAQRIR
jgi:hypothetical protein